MRAMLSRPADARERILDRISDRRDARAPKPRYDPDAAWEQDLHDLLGAPWPCTEARAFSELWSAIMDNLEAKGIRTGRGAFGGWDDADSALARAAWCIAIHTRPETAVETGVGHGITTRIILEALERNQRGHLVSIDLAPLIKVELRSETAAAVPNDRRSRWEMVEGSSRLRLPGVLMHAPPVDFFLHDSMHTTRNMHFELTQIWPALSNDGFILMDDIERNAVFHTFVATIGDDHNTLVIPSDDGRVTIGLIKKSGTRSS